MNNTKPRFGATMIVGLILAMTVLAGCASSPTSETQETSVYPFGCASDAGYSNQTGQACSEMQELKTEINNLNHRVAELEARIVVTHTTTTTTTSEPEPDFAGYIEGGYYTLHRQNWQDVWQVPEHGKMWKIDTNNGEPYELCWGNLSPGENQVCHWFGPDLNIGSWGCVCITAYAPELQPGDSFQIRLLGESGIAWMYLDDDPCYYSQSCG